MEKDSLLAISRTTSPQVLHLKVTDLRMPSRSNARGSAAKSHTKDAARTRNGQESNTSTEALLPSTNVTEVKRTAQFSLQESPEANNAPHQRSKTMTQARVEELNREGGVNKKKQKRRMKEAAKKAAEYNDPVGLWLARDLLLTFIDVLQSRFPPTTAERKPIATTLTLLNTMTQIDTSLTVPMMAMTHTTLRKGDILATMTRCRFS